jgi:protein O-GlcNAc transferase
MRACDLYSKGLRLYDRGDLPGAANVFLEVLNHSRDNANALNMLGVVTSLGGDPAGAEAYILEAIEIDPKQATYHKDLGNVYRRMKRYGAAKSAFCRALSLSPNFDEAYYDLGLLYHNIHWLQQALACYLRCIEINPRFTKAYNNAGLIYLDRREAEIAKQFFNKAVENDPQFAGAHLNLGIAYKRCGNESDALDCFRRAITLAPKMRDAYTMMGETLQSKGRISEAIYCYECVIRIFPADAAGWVNLGTAYHDYQALNKAMGCYRRALSIEANLPQAWVNKGIVHREQGQYERALACFRKALENDKGYENALVQLIGLSIRQCEWDLLSDYNTVLDKVTADALAACRKPDETPFLNLIRHQNPRLNFLVAAAWSQRIQSDADSYGRRYDFRQRRANKPFMRIGYLSANFRDHPTSELVLGLIKGHDRQRFEVFIYSYGKDDRGDKRREIAAVADRFNSIANLTDFEASDMINKDRVDVLVDLMGYTKEARMRICATRPAPIQVRYLGMAGTTGADFFDYIIVDNIVCPQAHQVHYSEAPVFMPYSYQVNNHACMPVCGPSKERRSRDDQPFVFCSFSTAYKIDPVIFSVWMRILRQSPHSVFWLMPENSGVAENLLAVARRMGVDPRRLVFKDKVPIRHHLNRLRYADLALDTIAVNGAATTSDALWAGVPVLTVKGCHFASRMSQSLLTAIGLPEMVVEDVKQYEQTAVSLANKPAELADIRKKLHANRMNSPLFDTGAFVKNLETAFESMWHRFINNEEPAPITLGR